MKSEQIALVCYAVNNAYRQAIGEMTKVSWDKLEKSAQESLIKGIDDAINEPKTPEEQHNAWLESKFSEGWTYGEVIDDKKLTRPQMIPFDSLKIEQRIKDHIFNAIVKTMSIIKQPSGKAKIVQVGKLPVMYIGLRPVYKDGTYGTGITWKKGQTIMVEEKAAKLLLGHPDVYVPGSKVHTTPIQKPLEKANDEPEDEENIQTAKDAVNIMNRKQAIIDYAEVNFQGVKLSKVDSLATLKQKVVGFIDQYGII